MSSPWMKFYPSDWRADPALRMCSVGARGLWMEMLCVMHEADPYGSLRVNGRAVSEAQLAMLAGTTPQDVLSYMGELEDAGVFSRDETGVVVSRRMQRDKTKAESDRSNGKRGGNPGLKDGVNPPVKPKDKAQKPEARDQKEITVSDDTVVPAEQNEIDQAFTAWNNLAAELKLSVCQKISKQRRSRMAARLKDCGGIEGWGVALAKVRDSPFLRGATGGGFRADLDFLLQAEKFTRLMEGSYDERPSQTTGRSHSGKVNGFDAFLAAAGGAIDRGTRPPGDGREFPPDGSDFAATGSLGRY